MATAPELTIEDLQQELEVSDAQLASHVEETDLFELAGCFENTDDYAEKLDLSPGQQTDVRTQAFVNGTQAGMKVALKYWRSRHSAEATFRALLFILLSMSKGNVAMQVCKYLSQNKPKTSGMDLQKPVEYADKKTATSGQIMNVVSSVMSTAVHLLKRVFLNFPTDVQLEKESIVRLYLESNELAAKFESLCSSLILSLKRREGIKDKLAHCMLHVHSPVPVYEDEAKEQPVFRRQREKLLKATNVDEIWAIVCYYFSFFNYYVVEHIIEQLGTKEDKERMAEYKEEFEKYAKRRAYECPTEFGYNNEDDSTIIVKLDDSYDGCTLFQIEKLRKKFCEILGISESTLRLITIEKGCYKLTFQAPSFFQDTVFPLSAQQQSELSMLGIVWIQCGDYKYQIKDAKNNPRNDSGDDFDDDTSYQGSSISPQAAVHNAHPAVVKQLVSGTFSNSCIGKTTENASNNDSGDNTTGVDSGKEVEALKKYFQAKHSKDYSRSPKQLPDSGIGSPETMSLISEHTTYSKSLFVEGDLPDEPTEDHPPRSQHAATHLNVAAFNGNLTAVKYCIEVLSNSPLCHFDDNGNTTLHVAADGGYIDIVIYLCEHCLSINESTVIKTALGKTPLHIAAQNGHLSVIQYFVETLGIDPMIRYGQLATPLFDACRSGNVKVVSYLFEQAQQYQSLDSVINDSTELGSTMLHVAAINGHLDIAKFLVVISPLLHCKDKRGVTPFQYAVAHGHLEIVDFLLSKHKISPTYTGSLKATPFQLACMYGHKHIASYLLQTWKVKEDLNATLFMAIAKGNLAIIQYILSLKIFSQKYFKKRGLHYTAEKGNLEIVKYLISELHFSPSAKDTDGFTPLHSACMHGHGDIANYLLSLPDCNAHAVTATNQYTALHYASEKGMLKTVKILIVKKQCKVYQKEYQGMNSLHLAVMYGHLPIVEFFTTVLKVDPSILSRGGWTPLDLAAMYNHLQVVEFLVSKLKVELNAYEEYGGATPLHMACRFGNLEIVKYLSGICEACNMKEPADVNGETPLHYAAQYGHLSIVKYLTLEMGYNPLLREKVDGDIPLHRAAQEGHSDIIIFFIRELKCDSFIKNHKGLTPILYWRYESLYTYEFGYKNRELHKAAEKNRNLTVLQKLIKENKTNINHGDTLNRTPLHYAAMGGNFSVVNKLVLAGADPLAEDVFYNLPIHYAAALGHSQTTDCLLEYCNPHTARGVFNMTPIDMATAASHFEIARQLKKGFNRLHSFTY